MELSEFRGDVGLLGRLDRIRVNALVNMRREVMAYEVLDGYITTLRCA